MSLSGIFFHPSAHILEVGFREKSNDPPYGNQYGGNAIRSNRKQTIGEMWQCTESSHRIRGYERRVWHQRVVAEQEVLGAVGPRLCQ